MAVDLAPEEEVFSSLMAVGVAVVGEAEAQVEAVDSAVLVVETSEAVVQAEAGSFLHFSQN